MMTELDDDSSVAAQLTELFGVPIEAADGGFKVRTTATHTVYVLRMIFNWRVVRSPNDHPLTFDRAWCFYGTGVLNLLRTLDAALSWDVGDDTAPPGWDKNARTGEYSDPRGRVGP